MIDGLSPLVAALTPWGERGIVVLVIVLILTGKLQWHSVADKWEAAWNRMDTANRELLKQNGDLIRATQTTVKVISALPEVGGEKR